MKVKKLGGNKYEIEETIISSKKRSIINKAALIQAIKILKDEILAKQNKLALKKRILTEIDKL